MAISVLIAEDDRNIAELLQMYLEKEGYAVTVANDGGQRDQRELVQRHGQLHGRYHGQGGQQHHGQQQEQAAARGAQPQGDEVFHGHS